jgi:tetratricopeptide (TPR) repeat protein
MRATCAAAARGRTAILLAIAAGLALPGCGPEKQPEPPAPVLEGVEAPVRRKIEWAREQVVADPSSENWARYAMVLHAHHLPVDALAAYTVALEGAEGTRAFELSYLAGLAATDVDSGRAIALLEEAAKLDPGYGPLRIRLGWVFETAERWDDARRHFEHARQLGKSPAAKELDRALLPAALLGLGRVAIAKDEPEKAIKLLEEARAGDPDVQQVHAALAMAYSRAGRKDEAAAAAGLAGTLEAGLPIEDPISAGMYDHGESSLILTQLGTDSLRKQKFSQALGLFERVLMVRPDDLDAQLNKAVALNALGRRAEAEPLVDAVLAKRPGSAAAQAHKGVCLLDRNELMQAVVHFKRALEIEPRHQIARHNLGRALRGLKQPAEAELHFRKLLEYRPHRHDVRLELAGLLATEGKVADARQQIRIILAIDPENKSALALEERLAQAR